MANETLITLIVFLMASSGLLLIFTLVGAGGRASTSRLEDLDAELARAARGFTGSDGMDYFPTARPADEPLHRDDSPEAGGRADARATRGNGPSSRPG